MCGCGGATKNWQSLSIFPKLQVGGDVVSNIDQFVECKTRALAVAVVCVFQNNGARGDLLYRSRCRHVAPRSRAPVRVGPTGPFVPRQVSRIGAPTLPRMVIRLAIDSSSRRTRGASLECETSSPPLRKKKKKNQFQIANVQQPSAMVRSSIGGQRPRQLGHAAESVSRTGSRGGRGWLVTLQRLGGLACEAILQG